MTTQTILASSLGYFYTLEVLRDTWAGKNFTGAVPSADELAKFAEHAVPDGLIGRKAAWHVRESAKVQVVCGRCDEMFPAAKTVEVSEYTQERWCTKCFDNYDGPPDGEAWSGGFADNH